jgi:hypothetical protein
MVRSGHILFCSCPDRFVRSLGFSLVVVPSRRSAGDLVRSPGDDCRPSVHVSATIDFFVAFVLLIALEIEAIYPCSLTTRAANCESVGPPRRAG